jgi:hypothetical protein
MNRDPARVCRISQPRARRLRALPSSLYRAIQRKLPISRVMPRPSKQSISGLLSFESFSFAAVRATILNPRRIAGKAGIGRLQGSLSSFVSSSRSSGGVSPTGVEYRSCAHDLAIDWRIASLNLTASSVSFAASPSWVMKFERHEEAEVPVNTLKTRSPAIAGLLNKCCQPYQLCALYQSSISLRA